MRTNLFRNRDKNFSTAILLGKALSVGLREGVELFSVNGNRVSYLTEGGAVIEGKVLLGKDKKLSITRIINESDFSSGDFQEEVVNESINSLMANITSSDYEEASTSLQNLCDSFSDQLKYNKVLESLQDKKTKFLSERIVHTPRS